MQFTFYQLALLFLVYAFLGWCTEVTYATVSTGKFVNRGFLNGPVCPIYGFGVVIVVVCLTPVAGNLFFLFVGSVLLTSLLEFVTGFVLEKIFHEKWWDYSSQPFQIKGYVCLKFSLLWGLACVFVMDIVQPLIMKLINWLPQTAGWIIIGIAAALFLADVSVTVSTILHLRRQLRAMQEISRELRRLSDAVGRDLSENVQAVMKHADKHKQEIERLKQKYQDIAARKGFGSRRLSQAFPKLQALKEWRKK